MNIIVLISFSNSLILFDKLGWEINKLLDASLIEHLSATSNAYFNCCKFNFIPHFKISEILSHSRFKIHRLTIFLLMITFIPYHLMMRTIYGNFLLIIWMCVLIE